MSSFLSHPAGFAYGSNEMQKFLKIMKNLLTIRSECDNIGKLSQESRITQK